MSDAPTSEMSVDEKRALLSRLLDKQRPEAVRAPVSYAQARLWFLDQFQPGERAYNLPVTWRLPGRLDVDALEAALGEIIDRHEALRTTFEASDGKPVQVISPSFEWTLATIDLTAQPAATREDEAHRLAYEESRRPFDLAAGPLIRGSLIKLSHTDHLLVVVMHHIVSDGWSVRVLYRELSALYEAFSNGRESPLPDLPVQYADFADWQQQWLSGETIERHLDYWRRKLDGVAPLELPTDRPRPPVQRHRGATISFSLEAALCQRLESLGRSQGATFFMTMLAALEVLLYRYTGQTDFAVGSPIANRQRSELEPLIGFFVNTLVLRADLGGDPTFAEYLELVRRTTIEAYDHQDLPFEKIVEHLRPERMLDRNPLFQVMLAVETETQRRTTGDTAGPPPETQLVSTGTAKFDLTISMFISAAGAVGFCEFNTDLFDERTVSVLVERFETILRSAVSDPSRRVSELPVTEEYVEGKGAEPDAGFPEPTTPALVAAHARDAPDKPAVVDGETTWTYAKLERRSNRIARRLLKIGAMPGQTVGILLPRSAETCALLLGIFKAGFTALPIDVDEPDRRLERMLGRERWTVVVSRGDAGRLPENVHRLIWEDLRETLNEYEDTPVDRSVADADAIVVFRSAAAPETTGLTHRAVRGLSRFDPAPIRSDDRVAQTSGMARERGILETFSALAAGACLIVLPDGAPPLQFARLLKKHNVSVLVADPAAAARLAREFPWACRLLRTLLIDAVNGAAPMQLLASLGSDVADRTHVIYDAAEAGSCSVRRLADSGAENAGFLIDAAAAPQSSICVLDAAGQPAPSGTLGEVCVLRRHPEPERSLVRTGDWGRRMDDLTIEITGRRDGCFKAGGGHIDPREIEAAVRIGFSDIEDAAVVACDRNTHLEIAAFVVSRTGDVPDADQGRAALRDYLPEQMLPRRFVALAEIPRTRDGEPDRSRLARMLDRTSAALAGYTAPSGSWEERLALIWGEAFGQERIGVHDNFFALGGHSLLATQIVARISDDLSVDLPLRQLFEMPTIAELAGWLSSVADRRPERARQSIEPVRGAQLPLSYAQQRLWFLDQFEPESAFYNLPLATRLTGHVDTAALHASINDLIARHESLRTTFDVIDGEPVQVVAPELEIEVDVTDLTELAPAMRQDEAQRLAEEEAQTPFDLRAGPLLRARLIEIDRDDRLLLITMHHIVTDGWSMGIFMKELSVCFAARSVGQAPSLPLLPIQYADFAVWQRGWLTAAELGRLVGYWKEKLSGAPPTLELPTDRPRPLSQVFRGRMHTFSVGSSLLGKLKRIGEAEQATLFMVLLAVFKTLLFRYTGQEDLVVGTPIANRTRPELESLIGFFANTLVLRTELAGSSTFREALRAVRHTTLDAYAHQDLPFEKLVEELQPTRSLAHNPLFQVMFVLQNMGDVADDTSVGNARAPIIGTGVAKFDLSAFLSETQAGLDAGFEYNTDLFDADTVERMASHYSILLAAVADDPDRALAELPILNESESRALERWNATSRDIPNVEPHRLVEMHAARMPDTQAIEHDGRKMSYADLNRIANVWARRLIEQGVGADSVVGICMRRSPEMVAGVLAVQKAGAAYLPLDPGYPAARLEYLVADAQPTCILTDPESTAIVASSECERIVVTELPVTGMPDGNVDTDAEPDDLAYVIYTSGSTGRPKGVAMCRGAMTNLIHWQIARSGFPVGAKTLQYSALGFDVSFQEIFATLGAGGNLVIVADETRRDPDALIDVIVQRGVERLFVPFVALQQLAERAPSHPRLRESRLREIVTAGEQLQITPKIVGLFQTLGDCRLYNQYGPSETHVVTELALTGDPARWPSTPPIGRPVPNVRIYVRDDSGRDMPIGVPGEICVGGTALARGYLRDTRLTAERFVSDEMAERLYRTGDRGRFLADGTIEFLGRHDDQVKVRGYRVEPGEVEFAIRLHAGVADAGVVARNRGDAGFELLAFVVATEDDLVESGRLHAFLATTLPEHMLPAKIVSMQSLPQTPSGKLDRSSLPDVADASPAKSLFEAPRTPVEEQLAAIWLELLPVERVGVHDRFFDIGGHSLLATRMVSQIRDRMGVDLPVRAIFERPTIAALAVLVVSSSAEEDDEIARLLDEIEQTESGGGSPSASTR